MGISFNALVRFPSTAYFEFNSAMKGIATIDSISREGEDSYHANISFPMDEMKGCLDSIIAVSGNIIEIIPEKEVVPAVVRKYVKKANGAKIAAATKPERKKYQRAEAPVLNKLLTGKWMTVKQMEKKTGWQSSTVHARLTGLRKQKLLESKNGPTGRMVYRIAASAA